MEAEENGAEKEGEDGNLSAQARRIKQGGFGSVSTRRLSKPIIAAVDGPAMGGGTELVLNSDLVIATTRSIFALPEVARGVVAAMGGIARISDIAGHQRASEMLLCGKPMTAHDAYTRFNFVNALVAVDRSETIEAGQAAIEAEAIKWAEKVISNSPDAVLVTKEALNMARDAGKGANGIDDASLRSFDGERSKALYDGDNIREGLTAFFEVCRTAPQLVPPMSADLAPVYVWGLLAELPWLTLLLSHCPFSFVGRNESRNGLIRLSFLKRQSYRRQSHVRPTLLRFIALDCNFLLFHDTHQLAHVPLSLERFIGIRTPSVVTTCLHFIRTFPFLPIHTTLDGDAHCADASPTVFRSGWALCKQ